MATVVIKKETLHSIQAIGLKTKKHDYLGMILNLFQSQANDIFSQAHTALCQADTKKLLHLAHSLKGSALCIGALKLAEHCGALEEAIRSNGPLPEAPQSLGNDLAANLEEKIQLTRRIYQETLQELKPFFAQGPI